ncbi:hypothetical protein L6164_014286 [Bauhinia variegata]|uniref:Uncharacterized protein n=1 Tax=Bauhinia variegata TaxID=167791 RepID=A0ACB9NHQ7_BAUVA|nr:hypothetical protein L6164_014286 [Bauhinia variegata]
MVYHSSFVDDEGVSEACGCPLLPLKSHVKGPAPVSNQELFRNYLKQIREETSGWLLSVAYRPNGSA